MRLPLLAVAAALVCPIAIAQDPGEPNDPWPEVNEKLSGQQHAEALTLVEKRLAQARARRDEASIARALVRAADLRVSLGRVEEAVEFLRREKRPEGLEPRVVVQLMYAQTLELYARRYRYELSRRTPKDGEAGPDAWTYDQAQAEIHKAYQALFAEREKLGKIPVDQLSDFIWANSFPKNVRGTLRDAVTYLFVDRLLDRSDWSPEQSNAAELVKLAQLLSGIPNPAATIADMQAHPLLRASALLDDLEAFHKSAGRKEAAFEARRHRSEALQMQYSLPEDRAAIRAELERSVESVKGLPWWSAGQASLAELYRSEDPKKAHALASAGEKAFPASQGGLMCRSLRQALQMPSLSLSAMGVDAARKRSVAVDHLNLEEVFFRAYPVDLEKRFKGGLDGDAIYGSQALRKLLGSKPVAAWREPLSNLGDFRRHRTYVTPPLDEAGSYVLYASPSETFAEGTNVSAIVFTLSDIVVLATRDNEGRTHARTISGATGAPLQGVSLRMMALDWNTDRFRQVATATTDASGRASFKLGERSDRVILVAKKGAEVVVSENLPYPYDERTTDRDTVSLVYTDRSIYRPGQSVQFKVVVFHYDWRGKLSSAVRPNQSVEVSLYDSNGQEVSSQKLKTNAFGSASGKLELPVGRKLGHWSLRTDLHEGASSIRVEEYRRPTFESKFDTAGQMRLNQPAKITGSARYYFGPPVKGAQVKWVVRREPGWLPYAFWLPYRPQEQPQIIGAGAARTGDDGKFSFEFTPLADERKVRTYGLLYRYRVTATVLDEGGESHEVSRSYPVGLVSVIGHISAEKELYLADAAPEGVAIVRTTVDGAPAPGKGSWTLSELAPETDGMLPAELPVKVLDQLQPGEKTPGDQLRPRWSKLPSLTDQLRTWKPSREIARGELTHGSDGPVKVPLPKLAVGIYRLRYSTKDDRGEESVAQSELIVASARFRPKLALMLQLQSSSVEVGDTARLLVTSGLPGLPMELEIVRRGGRIERRALKDASTLIEIPVKPEDRGGIAFTLTAVSDHQVLASSATLDVPFTDRELDVRFTTFRDALRPGVKETWKVTVRPAVGKEALAAEVLAYMYDRSLDVFGGHSAPSPLSYVPTGPDPIYWAQATADSTHAMSVYYAAHHIDSPPPLRRDSLRVYNRWSIGGPGFQGAPEMSKQRMAVKLEKKQIAITGNGYGKGGGVALGMASKNGHADPARSEDPAQAPPPPPPGQGPQEGTALRSDFSESAFFLPHLTTAADGTVSIEFTPPDSVTEWNVWAHAITKDVRGGSAYAKAKTSKDFLVRPYVPRFFREGDVGELRVVLTNAAASELKGELSLELLDPASRKSVAKAWGLSTSKKAFTLPANGAQTLSFEVTAPREVGEVAFKAVGTAGSWTDGELRVLPLLPSRLHLSQSRFVVLRGAGEKAISFEELDKGDDAALQSEQLVVTVDARLFEGVLAALPYLVEYPYECTEQTLNRFLSTGIVSSVMTRYPDVAKQAKAFSERKAPLEQFDRPDANRKAQLEETPWLVEAKGGEVPARARMFNVLDPKVAAAQRDVALDKLTQLQNANGGFPWFPGGPSSLYMTLYLLNGFARGVEYGLPIPKELVVRAWRYVAEQLKDSDWKAQKDEDVPAAWLTFLAYVWTAYPDGSWLGGAVSEPDIERIVNRSFARWRELSPYLKSMLAVTLARRQRQEDGRKVFASVLDSAKSDERLGVYWQPEDKSWFWYRDTIETHAMALQTLSVLTPKDERRGGLVQWLFLNKRLNQWKSTRATAEVIYALVKYLDTEGLLGVPEEPKVKIATPSRTFDFAPQKGELRAQWVVPGDVLKPPTRISVSKSTKGTVFTSATWHFATDALPKKGDGDLLWVSRSYGKRSYEGTKSKLVPLKDGMAVKLGDELEVELKVKALHEAEYVHVRDPRGAGFEPAAQRSEFKWEGGLGFYEEVRDTGTNFFFERLPAGEYTLRYTVRASMSGQFRVGPAFAQSMYAPEFTAYSTGSTLKVE